MTIVSRKDWGARPRKSENRGNLNKKSTGHWNGPPVKIGGKLTWDHGKCASLVRGIQNFHMDGRGWTDIAYNFVICPHGTIFEGRGLNRINGANGTNTGNRTSHAIMWLSGQTNPFTQAEKRSFRECVRYVFDMTDAPDEAIGHRDHKSTECPGNERYGWIHAKMPVGTPAPLPLPPKPEPFVPLKLGDSGPRVAMLIAGLNQVASLRIPYTGKGVGIQIPIKNPAKYDNVVREAVREFQRFLLIMWRLNGEKGPKPLFNGIADETVANGIVYFGKGLPK